MSPRKARDANAELEHLKRYLVERARGRCRPPQGEQDRALPEFRTPDRDRLAQGEFARLAGIHASTLSALFVRADSKLGDSWTGLVNALGLTVEEAFDAARQWVPPDAPVDDGGTPNLRLALEAFERSEGKVGRGVRRSMLRILHAAGDQTVDEWMRAIRYSRFAEQPDKPSGTESDSEEGIPSGSAGPVVRTVDAGRPLPASPGPAIPIRRRQTRR